MRKIVESKHGFKCGAQKTESNLTLSRTTEKQITNSRAKFPTKLADSLEINSSSFKSNDEVFELKLLFDVCALVR